MQNKRRNGESAADTALTDESEHAGEGISGGELAAQLQSAFEFNKRSGVKTWQESDETTPLETPDGAVTIQSGTIPRLFLSYRWEGSEHESWMDFFAGDLDMRGYQVVFDRDPRRFGLEWEFDRLLQVLHSCTAFVAVVTPGYVERVNGPLETGGPVRQEWELAMRLNTQKHLMLLGLLRGGDVIPAPFDSESVADFRNLSRYHEMMDTTFPRLESS